MLEALGHGCGLAAASGFGRALSLGLRWGVVACGVLGLDGFTFYPKSPTPWLCPSLRFRANRTQTPSAQQN